MKWILSQFWPATSFRYEPNKPTDSDSSQTGKICNPATYQHALQKNFGTTAAHGMWTPRALSHAHARARRSTPPDARTRALKSAAPRRGITRAAQQACRHTLNATTTLLLTYETRTRQLLCSLRGAARYRALTHPPCMASALHGVGWGRVVSSAVVGSKGSPHAGSARTSAARRAEHLQRACARRGEEASGASCLACYSVCSDGRTYSATGISVKCRSQ